MNRMDLFNLFVALCALLFLGGIWVGVHLVARKRIGARPIGCQGPSYDPTGKAICCKTGAECDGPEAARRPARRDPAPF